MLVCRDFCDLKARRATSKIITYSRQVSLFWLSHVWQIKNYSKQSWCSKIRICALVCEHHR